jgi:hypothetical protein
VEIPAASAHERFRLRKRFAGQVGDAGYDWRARGVARAARLRPFTATRAPHTAFDRITGFLRFIVSLRFDIEHSRLSILD